MPWKLENMPDQTGKTALVTGANSGIGLETARALAQKGAHVIMACRDEVKGSAAADEIREGGPAGTVEVQKLDLADLASVKSFAEAMLNRPDGGLDLLVANAGVMMPPNRTTTTDGYELQFGTNHLGHFALVGHLLPLLEATQDSRVVVVASAAHKFGTINFEDLQWESRSYRRVKSYGQSKLANLLFAYELRRRLERADKKVAVTAAHPGWTATNLQRDTGIARLLNPLFAMPAPQGALPTLYAATSSEAKTGDYIGPDGLGEMTGYPTKVSSNRESYDEATAARLWVVSEELTGVRYFGEPAQ